MNQMNPNDPYRPHQEDNKFELNESPWTTLVMTLYQNKFLIIKYSGEILKEF